MNTILYCRVSTDDQRDYGSSIDYQEEALRSYCANRDYTIIGCYKEDFSAKHHDLQRPEMKKVYEYCKRHKHQVNKVLFLRWDRFTRNAEFAFKYIRTFKAMGVEVNSIENPIDFNSPDWSTLIGVYCGNAQAENSKISKRTRDGIIGTLKKGKWSNKAPRGYKNVRVNKNECYVAIDEEKAKIVKEVFQEVAKGIESANRIRCRLLPRLSKSAYSNMLRNPFYMGKIKVPAHGDEPMQIVDGLHEPLIDEDTFYQVQDVLAGKRKKIPKMTQTSNPILFLRKFLICPICGHSITGATSTGNGGKYTYYHCCKEPSHIRMRAETVNTLFARYVGSLKPNKAVLKLYEQILKDIYCDGKKNRANEILDLEEKKASVESRLQRVEDRFLDGDISKVDYNRISERIKNELASIEEKISLLRTSNKENTNSKIDYAVQLIANLKDMIMDAPMEIKIQLLGSMFPEKIEFDGEKYRTSSYNKVLDIIYKDTSILRGDSKEKGEEPNDSSLFGARNKTRTCTPCSTRT